MEKNAYGERRDYKKIEIYVGSTYVGTTTWARNIQEARKKYAESHKISIIYVSARYATE